jgi:hypothetical protein
VGRIDSRRELFFISIRSLAVSRQLAGLREPKASPTLGHSCFGAHPHRALLARDEALAGSLSLRFLEHKMGRVFRSLAFGNGKPQRMKVQTIEQQFSLTEKNGHRRDVERVDEASS